MRSARRLKVIPPVLGAMLVAPLHAVAQPPAASSDRIDGVLKQHLTKRRGHVRHARRQTHPGKRRRHAARVALAPGDPPVTIADFSFSPSTITIHVGDTVTWTNNGPSNHTATANGGQFDTGALGRGQSGSHTFNTTGTFSYFCKIHPFMHGTVVVLGSGSSGGAGGGPSGRGSGSGVPGAGSGSGATTSGGSGRSSGGGATGSGAGSRSSGGGSSVSTNATTAGTHTLPATGMNALWTLLTGMTLLAVGITTRCRGHNVSRGCKNSPDDPPSSAVRSTISA